MNSVKEATKVFLVVGSIMGYYFSLFSLGAWWGGGVVIHRVYRSIIVLLAFGVVYGLCTWYLDYFVYSMASDYYRVMILVVHYYSEGIVFFYLIPLLSKKVGWNNIKTEENISESSGLIEGS